MSSGRQVPLPTDLWAKILEFAKPGRGDTNLYGDPITLSPASYAQFRNLQLVSRSFYEAFQHPDLSGEILIKGPLSPEQFRSLLCWVRVHAPVIKVVRFIDCSKEFQDAVLGALMRFPQSAGGLTTFYASNLSQMALCILPSFHCLSTCTLLAQHQGDIIDLSPLQALPSLHVLALLGPGTFTHLHILPHLRCLHLLDVIIESFQKSPFQSLQTIRQLVLLGADLDGLADRGLHACEALQVLRCDDCYVAAVDEADAFSIRQTVTSAAMTSLSQLTELQLCHSNAYMHYHTASPMDLEWVCQLTTLQELILDASGLGYVCANLTWLSRLTALNLNGHRDEDSKLSQWDVHLVDWSKMIALKTLSVTRCILKGSSSLTGLCQLPLLNKICLIECEAANRMTASSIEDMQISTMTRRPHIQLVSSPFLG